MDDAKPKVSDMSPPRKEDNDEEEADYDDDAEIFIETVSPETHPEAFVPIPPDGGFGWVVVLASFMCNVIVDGINYAYGILLIELVVHFGETKAKISLIGSLLLGVYQATGPIAASLVNKYGCRPVTFAGSIIGCLAFLISSFVSNVGVLIFTYGFLGGFGFGLIYLPSIVTVSYYFETKRALATGIAVCGSGFGAIIFAPIMQNLLRVYDWRNTLVILAGMILNCSVFACFYRPLQPSVMRAESGGRKPRVFFNKLKSIFRSKKRCDEETSGYEAESEEQQQEQLMGTGAVTLGCSGDAAAVAAPVPAPPDVLLTKSSLTEAAVRHHAEQYLRHVTPEPSATASELETESQANQGNRRVLSVDQIDHGKDSSNTEGLEEDDKKCRLLTPLNGSAAVVATKGGSTRGRRRRTHSTQGQAALEEPAINRCIRSTPNLGEKTARIRTYTEVTQSPSKIVLPPTVQQQDYARPMYRQDIFYSGSIFQLNRMDRISRVSGAIPGSTAQIDASWIGSYVMSMTRIPVPLDYVDDSSIPQKRANAFTRFIPKAVRDVFKTMTDVSLFKNSGFTFICVANLLGMIGLFVPNFFLVDYAEEKGVDKTRVALLLSIMGITNTLSRVAFGFIAGLPKISPLLLNNVTLLLAGLITLCVPFCSGFYLMATYAALYGLFVAPVISLTSVILCDLLGVEVLTNAFGLLTLARGISSAVGPPLAGMMFDKTKNYDISYYAAGGVLVMATLFYMLLHLPTYQARAQENKDEMMNSQLRLQQCHLQAKGAGDADAEK